MSTKPVYILISLLLITLSTLSNAQANDSANDGLIRLKSPHTAVATIDKLEKILLSKGMTVFKRVSHKGGADKVGLKLRPTELLIFGNPKVGTPLMQCMQTAAIDLPQKALAYEDEKGQTWLAYNDPVYMAKRHSVTGCDKAVAKITGALSKFANAAIKP
jgi:uncharacterized protein (DUF302 family)